MYGGIKGYGYNKGGLNHSYNPNMGYIKGGIVALRAIQPNEELTLNYVDGFINLGYSRKEAERIVLIEIAVKKLE